MNYLQRFLEVFLGLFGRKNLHSTKKKGHSDSASDKFAPRYVPLESELGSKHKQLQATVKRSLQASPNKTFSEGNTTVSGQSKGQPETESVDCKCSSTEQADIPERSALPEEVCPDESADTVILSSVEDNPAAEITESNTVSIPEARFDEPESIYPGHPTSTEVTSATVQKAMETQATSFPVSKVNISTVEEVLETNVAAIPEIPREEPKSACSDQSASAEVTEVPIQEAVHESADLPPVSREESPTAKEDLTADIAAVSEIFCNTPESTCPDPSISVEVPEVSIQEETHEPADLSPIWGTEIPTSKEELKDDIAPVPEISSEEQKTAFLDQSASVEMADVPAQETTQEFADSSSVLEEDEFLTTEAEGSNTAEPEPSSINPESKSSERSEAKKEQPLQQEETVNMESLPLLEETAIFSNEIENNIVSSAAANHEIAEFPPSAEIQKSAKDESRAKDFFKQTMISSELVLCDTENLHWSDSGENTFTLWENDTKEKSVNACATISIQRKETISFPGVQDSLDLEPLALHAARLILAPFCSEQNSPPRIIEVVQDGLIVLTCELQKDANTADIPFVTAAFTNRTAYLLTGAASMHITTEQCSKCLSLKGNQADY